MTQQITPIRLPLTLKLSYVYSYLVKTDTGFFLIDTGMTYARHQLEASLEHLCCHPGDLKLILLTHGDFDHTGNAKYLREKFHSQIAMHAGDTGMLENGDMFGIAKSKAQCSKSCCQYLSVLGKTNSAPPICFYQTEPP
jgi:hydroxyacylglutathione hydrolase